MESKHNLYVSALLEAPTAMVANIADFCIGSYAGKILENLENSDFSKLRESIPIKHMLYPYVNRKLSLKVFEHANVFQYYAPMNLSGWHAPYGDVNAITQMLAADNIDGVYCELHLKGSQNFKALWWPGKWTLQIFKDLPKLDSLIEYRKAAMNMAIQSSDLMDSIEHELVHMVQLIGMHIKNTQHFLGLPKQRVRDRDYTPQGFQREDVDYKGTQRDHALRDVEFYSNLRDSINEFKKTLNFIPSRLRKEFIPIFIGTKTKWDDNRFPKQTRDHIKTNDFFAILRQYDEKRWRLAVKRFIRFLDDNPNIL